MGNRVEIISPGIGKAKFWKTGRIGKLASEFPSAKSIFILNISFQQFMSEHSTQFVVGQHSTLFITLSPFYSTYAARDV